MEKKAAKRMFFIFEQMTYNKIAQKVLIYAPCYRSIRQKIQKK